MKSIISAHNNDNVAIPRPIAQNVDLAFRFSAVAICLAAIDLKAISPRYPELALAAIIFLVAAYLLLTTLLGYRTEEREQHRGITNYLGCVDSFLLGVGLVLLPFSLITSVAVAIVVAVRAVALGGAGLLTGHFSLLVVGALLTLGAMHQTITLHPQESVNIMTLIAAPLFLTYVAWRTYLRQKLLTAMVQELNLKNVQLKLNNYKLAKYLSPSLRKAIFSGKRVALETQRKRLSIFFSDIKGFSELSEELEAETLTSMLNLYLTEMSDIALKFGGTVDKFIGDAIMVFFGDPVTRGAKEDCIACVSMAIAMQNRMKDLNLRWASQGIRHPLHVRMGINTGFCTVGNFGTENRLDYTLLGTEVNKASRLESAADAGEILVSRQTYELIKDTIYCEPRGNLRLKGFKEPVETFTVVNLRANLGRMEGQCLEHSTDGFTIFMDVDSIPHMQKQRVMSSIEDAYEKLRKDIEISTVDDFKIFK